MHAHLSEKEYNTNWEVGDTYRSTYYPASETDEQNFRDQMWTILVAEAPDTGTLKFRPDRLELTTTTTGHTTVTTVTWCEQEGC